MTVVRTTGEADKHIRAASAWWRAHRQAAPELFEQELAAGFEKLTVVRTIGGVYRRQRGWEVRRLLLRRTRYHVYFVYAQEQDVVHVVAVWAAMRGRGPALKLP